MSGIIINFLVKPFYRKYQIIQKHIRSNIHIGFPANENLFEITRKFSFVFRKLFREIFYFFAEIKFSIIAATLNCAKKAFGILSIRNFIIS